MTPILSSLTLPKLYQLLLDSPPDERAILLDWFEETHGNRQGWEWMAREGRLTKSAEFKSAAWYRRKYTGILNWREDLPNVVFDRLEMPDRKGSWMVAYNKSEAALTDCARAAQEAITAGEIK